MFDPKNPEKLNERYERLEQLRQLPGDLLGGLPAMLERKAVYFPREIADGWPITKKNITVDPYLNRISRLTLFNMFKEGINDQLVGRVFAKKVKWSADTPKAIAGDHKANVHGFVDDVDGKATNAHVFLRRRFRNAVAKGLDGVLVEYPTTPNAGERSVAEERQSGLRPYWRPYASSAIWDWEYALVGGTERLVYLKLRDIWTSPANGEKYPALRVFYADGVNPVRFEVWANLAKSADGSTAMTSGKKYDLVFSGLRTPHIEIPFVPIATDGDEPMEAEPELVDAAWLNLAHMRKTGAVDNSQHQINFPIRWMSGITLEEAKKQLEDGTSSDRLWVSPAPGGQFGITEPTGTSWNAAENTIAAIEKRIEKLISKPLERESSQPMTAQGEANSEAARLSRLEAWVQGLTDSVNTLLFFTAVDTGDVKPNAEGGWGSVDFNVNWTKAQRDIEMVKLAWELVGAGQYPSELAFSISSDIGLVPEDVTFEQFAAMLEKDAQKAPRLFGPAMQLPGGGVMPGQPAMPPMDRFKIGDRVRVREGKAHDAMTSMKEGTVVEDEDGALGIKFDGMAEVHRWYTSSELEKA